MLLSRKNTSDADFLAAVLDGDRAVISRYYRESCLPIGKRMARIFPNATQGEITTALHDALMTVIDNYIRPKKLYLKDGKVHGQRGNKVTALIAYITRCNLSRQAKWTQRYGTSDIDSYLHKLETPATERDPDEEARANRAALQAFDSLGEKCHEIISCRLIHGMTYRDLVEEGIGTSAGTLRVEAHRCVKQLRARYLKFFFESPTR